MEAACHHEHVIRLRQFVPPSPDFVESGAIKQACWYYRGLLCCPNKSYKNKELRMISHDRKDVFMVVEAPVTVSSVFRILGRLT